MASNPWPTIHSERSALAADLSTLTEDQWQTPSLCAGWTVRDVLSHMTSTAKMTPPRFFAKFARSGFRFNAMNAKGIAKEGAGPPRTGLAEFQSHIDDSTHPPGPVQAMLGEAIVHSADIRVPLGIVHVYPTEALVQVADFYKASNLLIGAKSRIAGITLRATDADWTTGSGPEVSGPLLSLILAMTGREAGLDKLTGEGLQTLSQRMESNASLP